MIFLQLKHRNNQVQIFFMRFFIFWSFKWKEWARRWAWQRQSTRTLWTATCSFSQCTFQSRHSDDRTHRHKSYRFCSVWSCAGLALYNRRSIRKNPYLWGISDHFEFQMDQDLPLTNFNEGFMVEILGVMSNQFWINYCFRTRDENVRQWTKLQVQDWTIRETKNDKWHKCIEEFQ